MSLRSEAIVGAIAYRFRRREALPSRVVGTLLALAAIYTLLVLFSCVLTRFVVYGRTVKPLVPVLCLLGGWALARLLASRPASKPFAALVLVLVGAFNVWPHFTSVFPRDIEAAVLKNWGNPKRALTISGSIYAPLGLPVPPPDLALLNAEMLYPVRDRLEPPAGDVLLRFEHPLSYPPYQYEGHTPRERALIRTTDISVRLIPPRPSLHRPGQSAARRPVPRRRKTHRPLSERRRLPRAPRPAINPCPL